MNIGALEFLRCQMSVKTFGHDKTKIISAFNKILSNKYISRIKNSDIEMFGTGNASELILNKIEEYFIK